MYRNIIILDEATSSRPADGLLSVKQTPSPRKDSSSMDNGPNLLLSGYMPSFMRFPPKQYPEPPSKPPNFIARNIKAMKAYSIDYEHEKMVEATIQQKAEDVYSKFRSVMQQRYDRIRGISTNSLHKPNNMQTQVDTLEHSDDLVAFANELPETDSALREATDTCDVISPNCLLENESHDTSENSFTNELLDDPEFIDSLHAAKAKVDATVAEYELLHSNLDPKPNSVFSFRTRIQDPNTFAFSNTCRDGSRVLLLGCTKKEYLSEMLFDTAKEIVGENTERMGSSAYLAYLQRKQDDLTSCPRLLPYIYRSCR